MLTIRLTSADVARTHPSSGLNPMWEIALSLRALHRRRAGSDVHAWWRRRVGRDLARAGLIIAVTRILAPLAGINGPIPGFLTPVEGLLGLDAGIEAVTRHQPPHTPDGLAEALRQYHHIALAPYEDLIRAPIDASLAIATRALRDGGPGSALNSLRPYLRWQPPVLTLNCPDKGEAHLGQRSLVLQPSYFCTETPLAPTSQSVPAVLVYPAADDSETPRRTRETGGRQSGGELAALFGPTRAAILQAITACTTATTGELARRLGVSAATVSQHTSVLRAAGLIISRRQANTVHHSATRLATVLIRTSLAP